MMTSDVTAVLIPAFKKSVAFPDDLVKNIAGVSLVQRVIDRVKSLGIQDSLINLVTDSDEIRLIGTRNNLEVVFDPDLKWNADAAYSVTKDYIKRIGCDNEVIVLLSPYAPLLKVETLKDAIKFFKESDCEVLKSASSESRNLFTRGGKILRSAIIDETTETHQIESSAFTLLKASIGRKKYDQSVSVLPWDIGEDALEVRSMRDWWVCEKLLKRKRIIFWVIGNQTVGMGHIYRSLSLANELPDHEVMFATESQNEEAVRQILKREYTLEIYKEKDIVENIVGLRPALLIADILDTNRSDVLKFKDAGIAVVSFEDLGSGASHTDLTINELFDRAIIDKDHIRWGYRYFFLRDEFLGANSNRFRKDVTNILIAFGGVDQHDLTRKTYLSIQELCKKNGIFVNIVTGPGYTGYSTLSEEVTSRGGASVTHSTGVISNIMETVDLAITSNGRTVYELAHMNVPSIVIAQHERENTHEFGTKENGFVSLGVYSPGETEQLVVSQLRELISDRDYRKELHRKTTRFRFNSNKGKVVGLIRRLLEKTD